MKTRNRSRSWLPPLLTVLLLPLVWGCAGYRLGSMLPPDIRSVYVPTAVNQTEEPLLELACTDAILERIQTDGSLRIEDQDLADAELTVVLNTFELQAIGFEREDAARTDEYRARVTAAITLTRRATGEVVVHHPTVIGEATFPFTGDLTSAKREIQPQVAEDLARTIVRTMVETW